MRMLSNSLQAALQRSASQAEISERESKAQTKIDELSRDLCVERQSSEKHLTEAQALRSKLLTVETELEEQIRSEHGSCCASLVFPALFFHQIAYSHAENGNIELEHKESMRSTQQALFEAQAELQTLVEVTTVSHSFAARLHLQCRTRLLHACTLMLRSWARSFTQ
jgi:hypothetical protein